jgi:hypothetical protein
MNGTPYNNSNVTRALRKAAAAAGLRAPRPRFHDLRHTFVSAMISQGHDVVYVAYLIGDTVETTQKTYAHLFDQARHAEKSRASMEGLFGNIVVTRASEEARKDPQSESGQVIEFPSFAGES